MVEKIRYSYDVIWKENDVPWKDRMDIYLTEDYLVPAQVHWYSVTNSFMVAMISAAIIAVILFRNVRHDFVTDEAELDARNDKSSAGPSPQEREQELEEKGMEIDSDKMSLIRHISTSHPALLAAWLRGPVHNYFGVSLIIIIGLTFGVLVLGSIQTIKFCGYSFCRIHSCRYLLMAS